MRSFILFGITYQYDYEGCSFEEFVTAAGLDPDDEYSCQDMVGKFMKMVRQSGGTIYLEDAD